MNNKVSKINKGSLPCDKKGLIFEAYNIKDIDTKSCKTIFFDWAIDLHPKLNTKDALNQLLAEYGSRFPDHPMTSLLLSGLDSYSQKNKKRRKRKVN